MDLISIPAYQDNYIWLLTYPQGRCIIVDPGQAEPVLHVLSERGLTPDAILLTHHHRDHVDGVNDIIARYPQIPVYGPEETACKGATHRVCDGDLVEVGGHQYHVLATPGHTVGHVVFYCSPYLFCGDTLFSAGCGRLFEGSAEQMYHAFQRLAQLPDDTLICCSHEYTASNLQFAHSVLPHDHDISTYQQHIAKIRAKGLSSLPTTLQLERKINLFLRCDSIDLQKEIGFTSPPEHLHQVFAELRRRKDLS